MNHEPRLRLLRIHSASGLCKGAQRADDDKTVPRREDVECVCKLMSTIGFQLDANPKNSQKMSAYFLRMDRWSNNTDLESRLRFMLKVCCVHNTSPCKDDPFLADV